jgi:hypothetical protein
MRRRVGHAPAGAGGTEASALAREGDEALAAAGVAAHAQEAVGRDAAVEEAPELALDEARDAAVLLARPGEEGLEVVGDDPVEHGLFGTAREVSALAAAFPGRARRGDGRGHARRPMPGACRAV